MRALFPNNTCNISVISTLVFLVLLTIQKKVLPAIINNVINVLIFAISCPRHFSLNHRAYMSTLTQTSLPDIKLSKP